MQRPRVARLEKRCALGCALVTIVAMIAERPVWHPTFDCQRYRSAALMSEERQVAQQPPAS